jgi:hypothetical protein
MKSIVTIVTPLLLFTSSAAQAEPTQENHVRQAESAYAASAEEFTDVETEATQDRLIDVGLLPPPCDDCDPGPIHPDPGVPCDDCDPGPIDSDPGVPCDDCDPGPIDADPGVPCDACDPGAIEPAPLEEGSPDDFGVLPGNEPSTAHVPFDPPAPPPEPIVRAPDGTERPWPTDPERPEEQHDEPGEPPAIEPPEEAP